MTFRKNKTLKNDEHSIENYIAIDFFAVGDNISVVREREWGE